MKVKGWKSGRLEAGTQKPGKRFGERPSAEIHQQHGGGFWNSIRFFRVQFTKSDRGHQLTFQILK